MLQHQQSVWKHCGEVLGMAESIMEETTAGIVQVDRSAAGADRS